MSLSASVKPPRLVVVADRALAAALQRATATPVALVDHYLDALGELSRSPVAAVIGPLQPIQTNPQPTLHALRALAPEAALHLIVEPHQEPDAQRAARLGFDDYWILPVDAAALLGAIDRAVAQSPTSAPPAPTPPADGHDTDLVDQLLRDRSQLRARALDIIRRRAQCDDVTFTTQPNGSATHVPVQYAQTTHGYLQSQSLDLPTLNENALWLGRWLALEHQINHLQDLALKDALTGVWNRRYFDRFLKSILQRAKEQRFRVTLMIFDIDHFKSYNDQYGHPAGDEILIEAAKLMRSVVRKHDVVARIGGDEFGVIFWDTEPPRRSDSRHPRSVRNAAERFRRAICERQFPKLADQAPDTLTISAGLASYPWDGQTIEQLIHAADDMLLHSKRDKDAITFGPGAMKACDIEFGQDVDEGDNENSSSTDRDTETD
ncbi:MAG: hypothetical protein CMJ49_08685 [Planctomycetaceae bacterium]|nr:hypothetical protein [Planctomycetaceae bacterium]